MLSQSELEGVLFARNPEPMWVYETATLRFLAVNEAAIVRYGYSRAEFLTLSLTDIRPAEEVAALRRAVSHLPEGPYASGVWMHRTKAGELFWADTFSQAVIYAGRASRLVTARDVTERRQADEENRLLTEAMRDVVSLLDMDGRYLYVSPSVLQATGYTVEEVLGTCAYDSYHPEDYQRAQHEGGRTWLTDESYIIEWRNRCKDGSYHWFETRITQLPAENGLPCRLLCESRDIRQRKSAQEALLRERSLTEAIVDTSGTLILVLDREGRITRFNRACEALTGYHAAEVTGRPFWELFLRPDDVAPVRAVFDDLTAGHFPNTHENAWVARDGRERLIAWANTAMTDDTGRVSFVIATGHDITEQRLAEEALRRTQDQYRSIFENCLEGIFQTTPDGSYISANPALARIYGYESVEDLVTHLDDIAQGLYVDPRRRDAFIHLMREHGVVVNFESEVRRKDGTSLWISENARAVRGDDGEVLYYEGMVEDISERRQAEETLRASEGRYRGLVDSSPEAIFVYCEDRIVYVNPAALTLFGADGPDQMLGRCVYDIIHPDTLPLARERARRSQQEGLPSPLTEQKYVRLDGDVIHVEAVSTAITWGDKRAGQVLARDITERKEMEAERERMLAEAIARADRDPLTGLLNHRSFHKRLEEEAARAEAAGLPFAVALLDLDNFGFFNDGYGHAVGDDVLRRVAAVLEDMGGGGCVPARYGGDEFALLMPGVSAARAAAFLSDCLAQLSQVGYRPPGHDCVIPLQLSVGLAAYPEDGPTRQDVLHAADTRLLRVKTGGDGDAPAAHLRETLTQTVQGFSMLDALVTAVDNKDRYTRRHSEDVMTHCLAIAREMRVSEREQETLSVAALLHDVGKIGVPDAVLRKPGRLTDAEYAAVQHHPLMGAVIVGAVPGFEETLDAIRHHHERWDGGGYPFGLRGGETPLAARIMAVADAYSAMTTDRPYRQGMRPERALAVLEEGAGTQWDPACVRAFLRTHHRTRTPARAA